MIKNKKTRKALFLGWAIVVPVLVVGDILMRMKVFPVTSEMDRKIENGLHDVHRKPSKTVDDARNLALRDQSEIATNEHSKKNGNLKESTITPEIAKALMAEAASLINIAEQEDVYRDVIKRLCEAGYTDEAWRLILSDPGSNRSAQLWAFFSSAAIDSKTCSGYIAGLFDPNEKEGAIVAFAVKNFDKFPSIYEDSNFSRILQELTARNPNTLRELIGDGLRSRFDHCASNEEKEKINQMLLDFHSKNLVSDDVLAGMLVRNRQKSPFDLWSWISDSSVGLGESPNFEAEVRTGIIQRMVFENPTNALAKISSSSGNGADADLFTGLSQWAQNNPRAANDWYLSQRVKLTESQQDSAAKAFAMLALGYQETQVAESWANQIQNDEIRNTIIDKIHSLSLNKP
ncbi:MAG: hypothetical protein H7Y36_04085 [Armatimonadetes bacterium]|nr:hypothetical protein [Akkermansiaceae bacterium]